MIVPESLQHLRGISFPKLMISGLLPAAVIAIVLNLVLPDEQECWNHVNISTNLVCLGVDLDTPAIRSIIKPLFT